MKKAFIIVSLLLTAALSACAGKDNKTDVTNSDKKQEIEITLWTFPVGNWGNPTSISSIISGFQKEYPNIHVSVEHLTYTDGDGIIEQAIADNSAPDLVMEGPERLVANWGDRGLMADLADLWKSDTAGKIYENIKQACQRDGVYYEFPICMTAHCMAINYNMFEEAGALQYIDETTHTWTTKDFVNAVNALTDSGQKRVGTIYCKNQSGDQGTRALVNNLYGGTFTNDTHTLYTIDSKENIKALQLLYDLKGITFDSSIGAAEESDLFCKKELAMAFCWNVSQEIQHTINNPDLDFEVFPMAFPTNSGAPKLQGGIWGLGIFDNGEEERIEAAKTFIRYITENDSVYTRVVSTSTYWPVRDIGSIYVNDMLMTEYSVFMPYLGDYYQITPGWADARTAWWQMLQKVGNGTKVSEAVKNFPDAD